MGQAKRRQQQLGALYGTPEGSNAQKAAAIAPAKPLPAPQDVVALIEQFKLHPSQRDRELVERVMPLPPGLREQNLEFLAKMVSPAAMAEIRALLVTGSDGWERRYEPAGELAARASEVIVECFCNRLRYMAVPL
jgi:hypothetical protein